MRILTDTQKNFILNTFFKTYDYPGWANIANRLLENGEVIVPGDKSIWSGGIGNFIKTEKTDKAIDCILYKFDLELFLESKWYNEEKSLHLNQLLDKKDFLQIEIDSITLL